MINQQDMTRLLLAAGMVPPAPIAVPQQRQSQYGGFLSLAANPNVPEAIRTSAREQATRHEGLARAAGMDPHQYQSGGEAAEDQGYAERTPRDQRSYDQTSADKGIYDDAPDPGKGGDPNDLPPSYGDAMAERVLLPNPHANEMSAEDFAQNPGHIYATVPADYYTRDQGFPTSNGNNGNNDAGRRGSIHRPPSPPSVYQRRSTGPASPAGTGPRTIVGGHGTLIPRPSDETMRNDPGPSILTGIAAGLAGVAGGGLRGNGGGLDGEIIPPSHGPFGDIPPPRPGPSVGPGDVPLFGGAGLDQLAGGAGSDTALTDYFPEGDVPPSSSHRPPTGAYPGQVPGGSILPPSPPTRRPPTGANPGQVPGGSIFAPPPPSHRPPSPATEPPSPARRFFDWLTAPDAQSQDPMRRLHDWMFPQGGSPAESPNSVPPDSPGSGTIFPPSNIPVPVSRPTNVPQLPTSRRGTGRKPVATLSPPGPGYAGRDNEYDPTTGQVLRESLKPGSGIGSATTTAPGLEATVNKTAGSGGSTPADPNAAPSFDPGSTLPTADAPKPINPLAWALIKGGAALAASQKPFLSGGLGEGIGAGAEGYLEARNMDFEDLRKANEDARANREEATREYSARQLARWVADQEAANKRADIVLRTNQGDRALSLKGRELDINEKLGLGGLDVRRGELGVAEGQLGVARTNADTARQGLTPSDAREVMIYTQMATDRPELRNPGETPAQAGLRIFQANHPAASYGLGQLLNGAGATSADVTGPQWNSALPASP